MGIDTLPPSEGLSADGMHSTVHHDGHSSVPNMSEDSSSFVLQQRHQVDVGNHQAQPNEYKVSSMKLYVVSLNAIWV